MSPYRAQLRYYPGRFLGTELRVHCLYYDIAHWEFRLWSLPSSGVLVVNLVPLWKKYHYGRKSRRSATAARLAAINSGIGIQPQQPHPLVPPVPRRLKRTPNIADILLIMEDRMTKKYATGLCSVAAAVVMPRVRHRLPSLHTVAEKLTIALEEQMA